MRRFFGIRDFRLLFVGQAASNLGDALTSLTLLLLTQRLTGSVTAVAGTAIAIALPQLLFGLLAGVYVDRWDRKRVMIASDLARGLLVLGFVFVTTADDIWLMWGIAFVQATVGAFFNPAKGAYIPRLVAKDDLLAANSLMETSRIAFHLLGTIAAGIYAGTVASLAVLFILDAFTFVGSAVLEMGMRTDGTPDRRSVAHDVWADAREGVRALLDAPVLKGVVTGAGVTMFGLGAVNVLLVPFVVDTLEVSESWFGAIEAAQVVSMVAAGVLVTLLAKKLHPTNIISGALVAMGLLVAALSPATNVWHLIVVMFAIGWFITPLQASIGTLLQTETSDDMRGRIGSALGTVVTAASVSSMALAGTAAAAIGVRNVFVVAGAITVGAGLLTIRLFRDRTSGVGENSEARVETADLLPDSSS